MKVPALLWPGEICWTTVRNVREDPAHAAEISEGKPRPGILVAPSGARWLVIGTTSKPTFLGGSPRVRIPPHLWEDAHPALGRRAGYLWGRRVQFVPVNDIGSHIGSAAPELRGLCVQGVENLDARVRHDFVRLRADEMPGAGS